MTNEVWLSLDYGDYEITQRLADAIEGQYVGTVSVGGVGSSNDKSILGFKGCVKVS